MWQVLKQLIAKIAKVFTTASAADAIYANYDAHALVFEEIGKGLLERLQIIRIQPQLIVELGANTGTLTALLKQAFPKARLLAIEGNQASLRYANKYKSIANGLVSAVCSKFQQVPVADKRVDLIIAHLIPLWCDNLPALLTEIKRLLKPGGLFICSSLGPDTLQELSVYLQPAAKLTISDRLMDMHILGDQLMQAGLTEPVMEMELQQVSYSRLDVLRQELQILKLLTPAQLNYTDLASKAKLSFEIIYGHAWQAMQYKAKSSEFYVPIDQIKRR